jgi:hypothetical protein
MADVFIQSMLPLRERRTDHLTEAIINSAIDMEATLGSVYAIVYMRQHYIDMEIALRVILNQVERRMVYALAAFEPNGINLCCTESKFERGKNVQPNTSVWHRK